VSDRERTEASLRARGEAVLGARALPAATNPSADLVQVVHELQLHQVELELQRDELMESNRSLARERERFRDLYDHAPVGYLSVTADGLILDANYAAAVMLGRERDAVIGRRLGVFAVDDDRARCQRFLDQHFANVGSGHSELRFGNGVDAPRTVQLDAALRPDRASCRVTLTDVTWRRRAEDEMRLMEQTLHDAQRMEAVGRLAGGIAHDFNNLLTIINGHSELLDVDLAPDDPRHEAVREISQAGGRAAALTSQLLAFSRKQVLAMRMLDVNEIVSTVARMLQRVIGEDIELTTNLDAVPGIVEVDPGQLEQVLINLAVNARDAMPTGGTLRLTTRTVHLDHPLHDVGGDLAPGDFVCITVGDTGLGMEPSVAARVFEPFFTTKGLGRGTGLGLSMAYGVISQSHGHISVKSRVGEGSTFTILLPAGRAPAAGPVMPPDDAPVEHGTETILLVEDEHSVRTLTQRMLTTLGYTVLAAGAGDAAMRAAAEHGDDIDLLLTDVVMPSMGGGELAEHIRQRIPGIKVLYMSGYTADSVRRRGIEADGATLLQKPFTSDTLARAVRRAIDQAPSAHGLAPA
jgi:PAS domain S-box-containing protein